MGKVITFLTFLIFLDLFFIITGQIGDLSLTSIFFNALIDLQGSASSEFMASLLGTMLTWALSTTGVASILGGVAVVAIGVTTGRSDLILFIPIGLTLALIGGDLVLIFGYLLSLNVIVGTLIGGPILLVYVLTILDWLKGKD